MSIRTSLFCICSLSLVLIIFFSNPSFGDKFPLQTIDVYAEDLYCSYTEGDLCCTAVYVPDGSCSSAFCYVPGVLPGGYTTYECYDTGGGGGGGGVPVSNPPPPPTEAAISVSIIGITPSLINWVINPGSYDGQGNASILVFPNQGGTTYSISGLAYGGCTYTVSNSHGGGSSMTVFPNTVNFFEVQYSCGQPPFVDLDANGSDGPITISLGQSATLSWTSTDVVSCSASGSWSGGKTVSGSQSTGSLSAGSYTYAITCSGPGGIASDSVTVDVSATPPPPPPSIIAASSGSYCQAIRITWGGYSPTAANGFKIYRNGVLIATIGNVFMYEDQGLTVGQTYSYKVRAFNAGGDSTDSNTTSSQPSGTCAQAPSVSLSANPASITSGQSSTVTWSVGNNPTSCTASASPANSLWSGAKSVSGGSSLITNLTQTTTFTLTCANAYGSDSDAKAVTVGGGSLAPVVDLTAVPSLINAGDSSNLTWTVQNGATSCTASGGFSGSGWSGSKTRTGGSQVIANIPDSYDYTLTCTNAKGSGSDTVSIITTSDPTGPEVNLTANPTSVSSGGSTLLTWDPVLNAQYCDSWAVPANAQWSGLKDVSGGSLTVNNLSQNTEFILNCSDDGGYSGQDSAPVTVIATDASVSVSSNNAAGSWTVTPGGLTGSGTSGSYTVSPSSGGTLYTLTANNIANYSVTVSHTRNGVASGGSTVTVFPGDSIVFTITYTPTGPSFNYSLSNSGDLSVTKGGSTVSVVNTVTRTITAGVSQSVTLSVSGLPSGVSASIANNPCSPTCSSAITLGVSPSAPTGTYDLTVTGNTAGLANKTTGFDLTISPAEDLIVVPEFDPDPPIYVGHQVTWNCVASGGVPPYTYTWTGTDFPSPTNTASVNITYQTTGAKVANCSVLDSSGTLGTGIEQTIQVSLDPDFIEF